MSISIHRESNEIRESVTVRGVEGQSTRLVTIPESISQTLGLFVGYGVDFTTHEDARSFVVEAGGSDAIIWKMGSSFQLTITAPAKDCGIAPGDKVAVCYPIDGPERLIIRG